MTIEPTYSDWKTRNGVSLKNSVRLISSSVKRRLGLSEP